MQLLIAHPTAIPIVPDRPVPVSVRLLAAILAARAEGRAPTPAELGATPAEVRRATARLVELGLSA